MASPEPAHRARRSWILDAVLLFAFAAVLIWPLFRVKYLDLWASIESTFISDARFLRDHWPHPNWQPNWYCGTRTDYVYPPALRYGTAALAKYVPSVLPVRAYHLYVAFFYCFGLASIYFLVRRLSDSRAAAILATVATTVMSPSYLVVHTIRDDAPLWMPYRLNVLIRYGEGPHMTALAWIPLAVLFSFLAVQKWRPAAVAAAAFCCAMVVSNNFYGATALAILFPLLVWSVYVTHLDRLVWVRAALIPVLAYGLCAFWLVPSYLRITMANLQFVSHEGNLWSKWVGLGVLVAFVLLSDYLARGRREAAWFTFLCGALTFLAVSTIGNHYLDFRILGEPSRLFPELDLIAILFFVEVIRRILALGWRRPTVVRAAVSVLIVAAFVPSWTYVQKAHSIFVRDIYPERRPEYQLQDWVAKNLPGARVLAGGSVRFWYNAWNDLPQVGGGSDQGLLNWKVLPPQWQLFLGPEADISALWMQVLAADAIIVNGPGSRERYHDFVYPDKFRGVLPVLHDNGQGDTIYGIPRRWKSLARVVDRAQLDALPEIPGNGAVPELQAWRRVLEEGPDQPATMEWHGTDAFIVRATVRDGQAIRIAESFDTNWRATSGGNRLPLRADKLGLMVVDALPGEHEIRFEFPTPFSNLAGRAVALLSLVMAGALVWMGRSDADAA